MRNENEHGLPDPVVKEAHDFIHHAEQEEHQHEADAKRGLPDSAIDAEREFEQSVERGIGGGDQPPMDSGAEKQSKPLMTKVKEAVDSILPGSK